jgi:ferrochelatase
MKYAAEPEHRHGRAPITGVLLCNLGTPDEATTPAVRRYLAEFLSDPRVVEIPAAVWQPILHGVILRVRPARSAAKYATIWRPDGSPLRVWTERQAKLLEGYLGERGRCVRVLPAMRYGNPSIRSALDALKAEGADRVLVLPLYPQYAGATTASAFDAVQQWAAKTRRVPEFRYVNRYHDDAGYVAALERQVRDHWKREGAGERLVLSFHGMPQRTLMLGDPYHCECHATARLLRERLQLPPERVLVTFQSRFGRARWLEPYTEPTLRRLAAEGISRVDVMCPGFTADCLETLEEIAQEGRDAFLQAGGREFHYITCLNDRHEWIAALAEIALSHLHGWPASPPGAEELDVQRRRALALGALA